MLLNVSLAFVKPGERLPFRHEVIIPPQKIFGETVRFPQPAVFEGTYMLEEDSLLLEGRFTAEAAGSCAYCLAPVTYQVDVPFDEVFLHLDKLSRIAPEQSGDDEQLTFQGKEVDLDQLALSLAVLDLPMRLVCRDCSEKQAEDSLDDTHACQKESPVVHPFSALQQLLTKDQEV